MKGFITKPPVWAVDETLEILKRVLKQKEKNNNLKIERESLQKAFEGFWMKPLK